MEDSYYSIYSFQTAKKLSISDGEFKELKIFQRVLSGAEVLWNRQSDSS